MKQYAIGLITGALLAISAMMFMAAQTFQDKSLGDIIVNSITVLDENGNPAAMINATKYGGNFGIFNADGNSVVGIGAIENGGLFNIKDADGNMAVGISVHDDLGGYVQTINGQNKTSVHIGAGTYKDGIIILSDRYGNPGWAVSGKQGIIKLE